MKISLFPFLPVLLCMMGAMIMLLVLVAWDVREQTFDPAEKLTAQAPTAEEGNELRRKIAMRAEEADWFSERFAIARQEAEAELADYQDRLALAEKETHKIKDEILRLEQLAQQLDTQTSATPEEVEHLKRLLAEQQRRKAESELELAELQKDAAQTGKSYAIVPTRSADGTFRRPIYIECRNDKIIIQPEGVELLPSDFMALDRPDNPFDSVLRTIRQYYVEMDQIVRGSEPYPLMIVRPSGVEMYENAHTRMINGNWIKDFGYEIVNEDWNIQYPEPNEELCRRILQQLETARNRLRGYMMAMRMAGEPAPGYGYGVGNGVGYGAGSGGSGTMPQQFRTDHRGNVVPVGSGIQNGEDMQRYLEARRTSVETVDGRRQAAKYFGGTPGDLAGTPLEVSDGSLLTSTQRKETEFGKKQKFGEYESTFFTREGAVFEREGYSMPGEKPGVDVEIPRVGMLVQQQSQNNMSLRPNDWALKDATQFTRGISRTVRIRCEAERFVLSAQSGLAKERAIPITGSAIEAADQLVQAIWEFQESWGSAGENKHWKPILQVRVSPGGEQRLQELKIHLRNSGLAIEE